MHHRRATDTYGYDIDNRLVSLSKNTSGGSGTYSYQYDYRTRRITRVESGVTTALVFSGGTSIREYNSSASGSPVVQNIRGSDYGGGVGGVLYTLRSGTPSYTHENRRGDVVAKTNGSGALTFQAQYVGSGRQSATNGSTLDRQGANTKDTDPTGLIEEGMRYTAIEAGDLRIFLTRDPAGFVDGPNEYTYVIQNPWTKFDPEGLQEAEDDKEDSTSGNTLDSNSIDEQYEDSQTFGGRPRRLGDDTSTSRGSGADNENPGNKSAKENEEKDNAEVGSSSPPNPQKPDVANEASDQDVQVQEASLSDAIPSFTAADALGETTKDEAQATGLWPNLFPEDEPGSPEIVPPEEYTSPGYTSTVHNYVVTEEGELIIGRTGNTPEEGHIALADGESVQAAGEVRFTNGEITMLNNASGHYQPSGADAQATAEGAFNNAGFMTDGVYREIGQGQ